MGTARFSAQWPMAKVVEKAMEVHAVPFDPAKEPDVVRSAPRGRHNGAVLGGCAQLSSCVPCTGLRFLFCLMVLGAH